MRPLIVPVLLVLALAGCGSSNPSASGSSNSGAAASGSAANTAPNAQNHVHSIVIMPHNPNMLYLGAHYRLYKSSDGGKSWHSLTSQMMLSMSMDLAHPSTLYAVSLQKGLVKSTDGGRHWVLAMHGIPKGQVTGVSINPPGRVVLAYGNGLYQSTNGGVTWASSLHGDSITSAAFGSGNTAYASSGAGLFVSRDSGRHWKSVHAIGNQPIVQVVASGPVAYAVTAFSVLRTNNGGRTWVTLHKAPIGVEFVGLAPSDPNELLAEVSGKGFYATYDEGATWQRANAGIHDTNFSASTVRVAPSTPTVAYTGAWGLDVYATHDAGRHWVKVATLKH
jgi:photosystem II stability/assembly factor-like uncharacterized protein